MIKVRGNIPRCRAIKDNILVPPFLDSNTCVDRENKSGLRSYVKRLDKSTFSLLLVIIGATKISQLMQLARDSTAPFGSLWMIKISFIKERPEVDLTLELQWCFSDHGWILTAWKIDYYRAIYLLFIYKCLLLINAIRWERVWQVD